ncbi:MAG: BTAD domain-containing putative transcriptional regulator [Chloroflexota bacterium]
MFALNFLGQVEAIGADGAPLPLVSEKQISLLAYLAMTGETYTRPQLETLLWGEAAQENAQTSLRTAVYKLNKQFDGILKTTRKTIELDLEKVNSVDAIEFEEAISKEGIAALEQAVGIYQGEFLAGIIVPDSSEFEYWLLQTRERLRLALLSGLETLIENHSTLRQYEEAITYARQFLEIEPWQESIHRHLMLLLARTGQYAEALKQYQLCTEALEKELGVPPMAETVALYQRIVALRDRPNPLIPPSPYHLIGRDDALADIEALLAAPKNRIIVLTGMGGIGKTTLVKSLARRQAAHYLEGIYFIELADLESPSLLETTVSTAFSLTPPPSVSPLNHLATHLKEQEILLIIDNAEHLLSAVERLSQILIDAVSQLTIVITSREKLNLRTAVHYPLEGLSPTKEADNPAIQLFAEHAGQIDPDFKLADELETVAEICKLVGGVPLGIELAAAQLDIHSSDELLAELRASLTDLAVEYHDMPPRHRSMRALFNHTQALMTPAEQAALTKLAVFRGGFTREMADAVSGVSSKLLRRLIAKSLLQKRDDRFTIHTLIRQFALERLPEDDPIYAAHAERFCEEIVMLNEQPIGELLNFINEERENVRAMWQYGINHRSEKILGETTHPLARYYAGTHQFNEGNIIYEQAVDPLR